MKRYIQHEPFNVYHFTVDRWPHPVHKHSYFEIIFIRNGLGRHFINGHTFSYATGDVFLLGPEDYHFFEIQEPTTFCYIRFTELFIRDPALAQSTQWLPMVEYLLQTPYQANGSLVKDPGEKELLEHLLIVLVHEYDREEGYDMLIINGIMKALLVMLSRTLVRQRTHESQQRPSPKLMEELLLYICQHIQDPNALRIERLVGRFNRSASYLSVLFKKQMGESLQVYILKYKLRMIENRLRFSNQSITQITTEFGFTDSSHLTKLFKKHYGLTPGRFRQTAAQGQKP
ncbi:helix-turn-helix transcriptional regulator [Spirosoma foliorum]|uniref:Helix-turn-helix transcriptional regulator n=1 Tax=Spirosoma foliorum TaxID=2710596 RepID=A0A7G5H3D1_9BACT|nr:AraC family transcriptional regulator [Spirosoma foliorum]QMW05623.1 helix-turn-helix transcriptional regulator [Spirosoma foliorum]